MTCSGLLERLHTFIGEHGFKHEGREQRTLIPEKQVPPLGDKFRLA